MVLISCISRRIRPGPTPIPRIIAACTDRAWFVVLLTLALSLFAASYTARHFAMTTDSLDLISPDVPWRQNKAAFDQAFPNLADVVVVVLDGVTPEIAETGAATLAARLSTRGDLFQSVQRPDGGPFFDRNGLLFLPTDDVATTTQQVIAAQPFLGPLAADPSLRGVVRTLSDAVQGVELGQVKLEDLDHAMNAIVDALERVVRGEPAFFSWQTMISGRPASQRETRRIVLVQPKVDTTVLMPGAQATDAIRQVARALQLDADHGISVRLTGSVVLADEELASVAEHFWLVTALMVTVVLLILWLAVRSARIVACILITTLLGLVLAAGVGLLAVGRFNLISVAFIPLFVGLGIDFAVQFSVRYRAERLVRSDLRGALIATGSEVGGSLALAAAATAIGFFSFVPTTYSGASELGLIAGFGMVIAFALSITFLPALLLLVRPGGERRDIGFTSLAPLDRFLLKQRKLVIGAGGLAAAVSLACLPLLRFDANPLHLRSPRAESVSTLLDLTSDPDRTPNAIEVLAPSVTSADELARRLSTLPEVRRAVTATSFIPDDQPQKLALIEDAAALLDPTLNLTEVQGSPTDAETIADLAQTASALRQAAEGAMTPSANHARRLATVFDRLATARPAVRERASETLIGPLTVTLDRLRSMLQAEPVSFQTLPPHIVQDWVARDGRARIEVVPSGNTNADETLRRFSQAVLALVPDATGPPISQQEAARMIVDAFLQAGISSLLAIIILLGIILGRTRDVVLTLIPILLTGLATLGTCVLIGQPLNFANIIALPLLFGIGVAFNIYFVMAWRSGKTNLLQSSLARAVLFSGLTTGTAFGTLWFSSHPGTASMGRLLMISLAWTLVTSLLFGPALLGPPARSGRWI